MHVPKHILERLRAEYREMPDLALKVEQAARLCGLELALCTAALNALVESKFLSVRRDGAYALPPS